MDAVLVSLPDFKVRIYARFGKNKEFFAYPFMLSGKCIGYDIFESKKSRIRNLQALRVVCTHDFVLMHISEMMSSHHIKKLASVIYKASLAHTSDFSLTLLTRKGASTPFLSPHRYLYWTNFCQSFNRYSICFNSS